MYLCIPPDPLRTGSFYEVGVDACGEPAKERRKQLFFLVLLIVWEEALNTFLGRRDIVT